MSKPLGSKVPFLVAQKGIAMYDNALGSSPLYKESITYTIDELEAYFKEARAELISMGITNPDNQCVSLIPYIGEKDDRLNVLIAPAILVGSPKGNEAKHQFNKSARSGEANDGDNPYNNVSSDLLDPYNNGAGKP